MVPTQLWAVESVVALPCQAQFQWRLQQRPPFLAVAAMVKQEMPWSVLYTGCTESDFKRWPYLLSEKQRLAHTLHRVVRGIAAQMLCHADWPQLGCSLVQLRGGQVRRRGLRQGRGADEEFSVLMGNCSKDRPEVITLEVGDDAHCRGVRLRITPSHVDSRDRSRFRA